jgi:hypothetical protein
MARAKSFRALMVVNIVMDKTCLSGDVVLYILST